MSCYTEIKTHSHCSQQSSTRCEASLRAEGVEAPKCRRSSSCNPPPQPAAPKIVLPRSACSLGEVAGIQNVAVVAWPVDACADIVRVDTFRKVVGLHHAEVAAFLFSVGGDDFHRAVLHIYTSSRSATEVQDSRAVAQIVPLQFKFRNTCTLSMSIIQEAPISILLDTMAVI